VATRAPGDDQGDEHLTTSSPRREAGGLPAVVSSARHLLAQMGPVRATRTMLRINQPDGFDCPGCAWPEAAGRSHVEFCENGAKAVAEEATQRRITAAFFAEHPVSELAQRSDHWLGQQGRLTEPVVKRAGSDRYEPIGWDEALDLVAGELAALGSPDRAAFYTSGRTSNEAAFLYQLLVRAYGTNNLPDCSNMCHESSGVALGETIGIGKGTVTLDDVERTDLLFVVGQNPGTNHPRMLTSLEAAKRRGARVVAVNPLPEAGLLSFKNPQRPRGVVGRGTGLADVFLQVRVGGDLALFQALGRRLLEEEARRPGQVLDHAFIDEHTTGFEAYRRHVLAAPWDELVSASGLTSEAIDAAVAEVLGAERIIVCWAMGLTQHRHAVPTIREVVNFLLLRGNIGRQGAGACPVRGHSNVQGDRTMGIYEKPSAAFLDALGAEFGFEPPRRHGHDTVEAIRAMAAGDVEVFVAMGGNFVAAAPDTAATAAALRRCRLTVQVSTKLNRSHVECGEVALILPCLGRTEVDDRAGHAQVVSVEDSMGVVHASRGRLRPASDQLRSEVAVVCGLGRRLVPDAADWDAFEADHDVVRDRIEAVVPGFERYNERLRDGAGFTLPNPPRDERRFPTASGRAVFTCNERWAPEVPDGHLLLQTLRSHDQFNTTIYGLDDRYRGISQGRRVVFTHPDDLAALGLADGQVVDVVGVPDAVAPGADGAPARRAPAFRLVAYPVARGTCAAYFPEANVLVPLGSVAEGSGTPTSKSVVVRFEPTGAAGSAHG
jgi:formate dehydrogenase major subunit